MILKSQSKLMQSLVVLMYVDTLKETTMTTIKKSYTFTTKPNYTTTTTFGKQKVVYSCQHNVDDIDERGVIEIPATNDTVIYQDEEGQYYEVPVSDLIDYDGDDGEITYHSKGRKKVPEAITRRPNLPLMMFQQFYPKIHC